MYMFWFWNQEVYRGKSAKMIPSDTPDVVIISYAWEVIG